MQGFITLTLVSILKKKNNIGDSTDFTKKGHSDGNKTTHFC